ncbi:mechanosensitive ion channel family protein [Gimesia panareensis]|uniref:Small-conductance mechanosensitive channel n=1 Tax=Gimesia panareensis TaxID=2527978 RepID=A0A518A094_9PLAN|nr:mechanosensitive ion channel domain-containing protein [Gimesia panareensis]QDT25146.1 Small-conductance mechanosensitive channel [Gimesia panareensis]QDU48111.1 Small-conductance mechanosensitive channel [Gimesia panareensis]
MWSILAQKTTTISEDPVAKVNMLWETVKTSLTTEGMQFAINLVVALAVLLIGKWIANILSRFCNRLMKQAKVDETLARFLSNIIYSLLLVIVILAALSELGIDTTSLAAVLAAAGFAVGMAFQGTLSNFASGVMLILFKPFRVGDYIEAGGTAGIVEEIQIFTTSLRTGDNIAIVVPNGQITGGTIRNFSIKENRRIDLVVGCGYDDDLKAVKAFLEELVHGDGRILEDPEPVVAVSELADSSVNFVVRPWVKNADYWATRWDLTERIKLGFDERGFTIPYPSRDVHLYNESLAGVES